ncbi:hypothetical protein DLS62_13480, partial [Staphylococcus pseudintermedius]|uniref:hypothetical protein n=1 Tax=Staphylococcus pseudintermedius TaxID=283734 RepID=UPI0010F1D1C2
VFASDFLQIPLRNGHPCLSLTVPTTKPVTDFHRQDVTHAGRTEKSNPTMKVALLLEIAEGVSIDESPMIRKLRFHLVNFINILRK